MFLRTATAFLVGGFIGNQYNKYYNSNSNSNNSRSVLHAASASSASASASAGANGNENNLQMRVRMEKMVREAQEKITSQLEVIDGKKFREDKWVREGGGGGWTRVLQDGNVFEKAGVNVSAVMGDLSPEAQLQMTSRGHKFQPSKDGSKKPLKFFAVGISLVIHPHNPNCPTMHANYRYFEIENPEGADKPPITYWFGGGADLTPSYLFEEDAVHFHKVHKDNCDKTDKNLYPRFKKWCDEYFFLTHRKETRGVGGIFFDDVNETVNINNDVNGKPKHLSMEEWFQFARDNAMAVTDAYCPIVKKRKDLPYTEEMKRWQQLRRGRYVEFNLIYDRGTKFGLQSNGRIESILMSLPLTARWEYDMHPEKGSREDQLIQVLTHPKEWV